MGCGKIPPQSGGNVAQRQRENPPTVWGECHEVTKGDGPREGTGRVRLAPVKKEREAFPQKGEQAGRVNLPVDGSLDRFCDPLGQNGCDTGKPFLQKSCGGTVGRARTLSCHLSGGIDCADQNRTIGPEMPALGAFCCGACRSRDCSAPQARKGVPAIHPPDGSPPLFAHLLRGTLCVPFPRGPAPAPPQPFEKGWRKLYVLLTFGFCASAGFPNTTP